MTRLVRVALLTFAAVLAFTAVTSGVTATTAHAALASPAKGTTVRAVEGVNLRTGPGTEYAGVTVVPAGATATVLSPTPQNGFYRVDYRGSTGWTHGDYWDSVAGLWANGYRLATPEEQAVRWIAANTVPRLQGTRAERLTAAGRVTWWSLKEGVLGLGVSGTASAHTFSHCDSARLDPLASCAPQCCWQVGIAAAQEPNYSLAATEATAARLYPGTSVRDVLAHTATYSGYPSGSWQYNAIVNSTGDFRNSWLLRNHGVGFTHNAPSVHSECVVSSLSWCYGTGWTTTARYAPTKTTALRVIGELTAVLDGLAP